jgi:hypothetical protein
LKTIRTLFLLTVTATVLFACRKNERFTDDSGIRLEFSQDTVLFDTVFTTVGTVTKRFTARNPNANAVRISVGLEGGSASDYRINVDGATGTAFTDVDVLGGDSLYIFVEATLGPGGVNTPFIIEDRILFNTNGSEQEVRLMAWGQDALFYPNPNAPMQSVQGFPQFSYIAGGFDQNGVQICGQNVIWTAEKPIVLLKYGVVDSCNSLTIEAGARVYVHGGAGLWVYRGGQITANGTLQNPITFQGDRREEQFAELPGQWDRIWINEGPSGMDNKFEYVSIKNALIGIQCEPFPLYPDLPTSEARLMLNKVRIRNCSAAGILSRNYKIRSTDLLVGDCGQYSIALTGGGEYFFDHTTVANYWDYEIRQTPAFYITNGYQDITSATQLREITGFSLTNGIIYGANENEFQFDLDQTALPNGSIERMMIKTTQATGPEFGPNYWQNQSPGFLSTGDRDFHLGENSNARDKSDAPSPDALTDLDGNSRYCGSGSGWDLGCFEYCQ